MIQIENLTKSFGSHILFENINFKINRKERVGIVGRNGHGKTTIFNMIIGKQHPDSGKIILPKSYTIGHLQQEIRVSQQTVIDEALFGLKKITEAESWKIKKILFGLGFSDSDMNRHPDEFSEGFKVRLNLAKVLAQEPNLLLLDEPTNFLDINSIRWLKKYLQVWPYELLIITHDRSFMDDIVTHIIGIHRKKIRKIPGNTEKYYAQIAQEEEIYEKTREKDERRQKEIERFISRFRAKARLANMVQSRVKTLDKMEKHEKLENIKLLDFSFLNQPFPGKQVMSVTDLSFSFDSNMPLLKNLSVSVNSNDRIGIIGKNGKGKTTLLRLLAGDLKANQGKIYYHPKVSIGFFDQDKISDFSNERTVEEEILLTHEQVDRQLARNICGAMMFEGDDALKKIMVLSGGEKNRVMLGKLLVTPINLLLLDEITNHFDLESCDALLEAIDNFDGAVVLVTHNEMFLHALAQRLIVFQNDEISVFEGTYQEFLDKVGWDDESDELKNPKKNKSQDKQSKKEIRKLRSEIVAQRSKIIGPLKKEIDQVEKQIMTEEEALQVLNQDLIKASETGNGKVIETLSPQIHALQILIDNLYEKLEKLYDEKQLRESEFE